VIDDTKGMVVLAVVQGEEKEEIVGIGEFIIQETTHTAEVAFAVEDTFQKKGVEGELLAYLTYLGVKASSVLPPRCWSRTNPCSVSLSS